MSDSIFELYRQSCVNLVRSMVIKSTEAAAIINDELTMMGIDVDQTDPRSWKYYLHLSGQYHPTDTLMEVTSVDTLEVIPFTRGSLQIHRSTARAYAFNSLQYRTLLARFPEQEMLIRGIVDPVDIDEAIAADDFTILHHDTSLVETNESDLMLRLQAWVDRHMLRWHVPAYGVTDELYVPSALAIMYVNLPNEVMNIRLDNCRTGRVHSYHIWTYLRSNGRLDTFRRTLTTEQALFLYRNIRFILANAGKTDTFELLIRNLMTNRGLPVYAYDARHNVTVQPEQTRPLVEMIRYPVEDTLIDQRVQRIRTPEEVMRDLAGAAPDNAANIIDRTRALEDRVQRASTNVIDTKVLESVIATNQEISEYTLPELLAEHWIYLAATGVYETNLQVINPHTGNMLQLSPNSAYILYLYLINLELGVTLDTIPTIQLHTVIANPLPQWEVLTKGLDPCLVEPLRNIVLDIPTANRLINPDSFFEHVQGIHNAVDQITRRVRHASTLTGQAQMRLVFQMLTRSAEVVLSEETNYEQWLFVNDIDIEGISRVDALTLAESLLQQATGLDTQDIVTPQDIQRDLVTILETLSSYDIQFIRTVIGENAFSIDVNKVRIDLVEAQTTARYQYLDITQRVQDVKAVHHAGTISMGLAPLKVTVHTKSYDKVTLPGTINLRASAASRSVSSVPLPNLQLVQKENNT